MFFSGSAVLFTTIIGAVLVLVAGMVTLWTMGWHVKRPRWVLDAKIGVSVFGAIVLAPMLASATVVGMLSMVPVVVLLPFIAATDVHLGGAS